MRINRVQLGEIYIVLFIQNKKKNPNFNPYKPCDSKRFWGFSKGGYSLHQHIG